MKILKEAKENLPIPFLTDLISKGWEEVGYLKADIEAIKDAYKGTKQIEELIQGLIDAYLVFIGQLELHLQNKSYLDYPDDSGLAEPKKERIEEDLQITINTENVEVIAETTPEIIEVATVEPDSEEPKDEIEEFEYFCDFDEPDMSQPKLTDKDLYDNE